MSENSIPGRPSLRDCTTDIPPPRLFGFQGSRDGAPRDVAPSDGATACGLRHSACARYGSPIHGSWFVKLTRLTTNGRPAATGRAPGIPRHSAAIARCLVILYAVAD